jgi:tripartite-type tricarboxylate transporter receptor subunit TctC
MKRLMVLTIVLAALTMSGVVMALEPPAGFLRDKPLTLVVGWNAGSTSDRNARSMKPYLDQIIPKALLIVNKPGASSLSAWNTYFAADQGDAYTFIFANWPVAYQSVVDGSAKYKMEDFYQLGGINNDPIIFLRRKDDNRWGNFADFVKDCKKNPGTYKVAMTGPKSFQNLCAYYIMDVLGIKFQMVNSPGGANEANQFLAGGHVDLCLTNAYSGFLIREVAYALGLMSTKKIPSMWPEATSISEQMGQPVASLSVLRGYAINQKAFINHPDRVLYIQKALDQACTNPGFLKDRKASNEDDVAYWIPKAEYDPLLKENLKIVDKYKEYLK